MLKKCLVQKGIQEKFQQQFCLKKFWRNLQQLHANYNLMIVLEAFQDFETPEEILK